MPHEKGEIKGDLQMTEKFDFLHLFYAEDLEQILLPKLPLLTKK